MTKENDIQIDYTIHDVDSHGRAEVIYSAVGHPDITTNTLVMLPNANADEVKAAIMQMAPIFDFTKRIALKESPELGDAFVALKGTQGRIETCCPECLQKQIAKLREGNAQNIVEKVLPVEVL